MKIRIVDDEACPKCGRLGSPKVEDKGVWAWKCPSTYWQCPVAYYFPGTNEVEWKQSPEKEAATAARIHEEVEQMMVGKVWITKGNCSKLHPEGEPVPEGWHSGAE